MKKIYGVQTLKLSELDNHEFAQLMTETAKLIEAFSKKAKSELAYVSKLVAFQPALENFQASLHTAKKSQTAASLAEVDRERDEAVTTLFNLHKGYALVKTPTIKAAYDSLAIVFASYKNITSANYEKESESITQLLKKLAEPDHVTALTQLNLTVFVDNLRTCQRAFERAYQARLQEMEGKKPGRSKQLRGELTEIYDFFVDYTAVSSYAYPERAYFAELRDQLNALRSRYKKHTASKKTSKGEKE